MDEIVVVVKSLTVRVVTGDPSEDPYGQGFSAIFAEAAVDDAAAIERLAAAQKQGSSVTLRCAMLDVSGPITKTQVEGSAHRFIVSVKEVIHRKPTHAWEHPEPIRRRPA